jgi:hypothetical protein
MPNVEQHAHLESLEPDDREEGKDRKNHGGEPESRSRLVDQE